MIRRTALATALTALLGGMAAASAGATITATKITSPGDPFELIVENGTPPLHIAGTATGSGTTLRVYCLDAFHQVPLTGWLTPAGGAWSTDVNFKSLSPMYCRLHAYPDQPTPPSDLNNFTGPAIRIGHQLTRTVASGANAGMLDSFDYTDPRLAGFWQVNPAGTCALDDGHLVDPTDFSATASVWLCTAMLGNSETGSVVPGGRSEIKVDGQDAYAASTVWDDTVPGYLPLTVSFAHDSQTDTVTETEPILRCADATYPPSDARCATLVDTGVRLERTVGETQAGAVVDVVDRFRSTGAAHALDLSYGALAGNGGANITGWRFPGEAGYATHTAGDTKTLPAGGPVTVFLRTDAAKADGAAGETSGSWTFSPRPTQIRFSTDARAQYPVALSVPAGGVSSAVQQTFGVGSSEADVAPAAATAANHQSPPLVTIGAPADGTHVPAGQDVTLSGSVFDNVGVAKLVVAGTTVTPAADGTFARTVSLLPGPNTLTVTATDATGAATSASVTVTADLAPPATTTTTTTVTPTPPPRCVVPKLTGLTRTTARRRLAAAHCVLGKVRRRTTRVRRRWNRVVAQGLRRGTVRPLGTRVSITLGHRPAVKHRH